MRSLAERIAYTLGAAALGMLRGAAVLFVALAAVVVVTQALLHWYATGSFTLFPAHLASATQSAPVVVSDATPAEAAAIRKAVSQLRYRLPAGAVAFTVVEQTDCPQCQGGYEPFGRISIVRSVADQDGPALDRAVAHEVGHFVDNAYLSDAQRAEFMQLRHMPGRLTWLAPEQPWQYRPVEDFAEVFAFLNLTTVDSGPQTAYGPVRDPAALVRLLGSAGVRLGSQSDVPNWPQVFAQEIGFAADETTNPYVRMLFAVLISLYIVMAGLTDARDAWSWHHPHDSQRPREPHHPRDPDSPFASP